MDIQNEREYIETWINDEFGSGSTPKGQISSCLNDIQSFNPDDVSQLSGVITKVRVNNKLLYHFSAGKSNTNKTCTLFFVITDDEAEVVGIYQHTSSSSYSRVATADGWDLAKTISL